MNNRHLYWLAGILTLSGAALFLYKVFVLHFPVLPGTRSNLWELEMRIAFHGRDRPVKVSLFIPASSRRFTLVDENFVSRGYGLTTTKVNGNRQAVWAQRQARGEQVLYYRAVVQRLSGEEEPGGQPPKTVKSSLEGPALEAGHALLAEAKQHSADLDTLTAQIAKLLNSSARDTNAAVLLGTNPTPIKVAETAVQILALDKVPAELVRGIRLALYRSNTPIEAWVRAWDGSAWHYFDPLSGQAGLPGDVLPIWIGSESLLSVKGGTDPDYRLTVSQMEQAAIEAAAVREGIISPHLRAFSLFTLPLVTQEVFRIMLMVPLGAFVLVIMRNMIGVKTFGTFMPVLIALAFRQTQLLWGLILFTVIVGMGLSVRFYFERLKLLLVPRLASVLIVVVILMLLVGIVGHQLGIEKGLSIALFPMVIITMTIERMSIVWEERGPAEALKQGFGSLATAALVYLLMNISYVEHLMFVFPELLLPLLAGSLLLGRYSGYRLFELWRFKALAGRG